MTSYDKVGGRRAQLFSTDGCSGVEDGSGTPGSSARTGRASEFADVVRQAALIRTIEAQIVPRLLIARRPVPEPRVEVPLTDRAQEQVDATIVELTRLVLEHPSDVAVAYVRMLRDDGASVEHVLLNVLSPVARRIGTFWEADTIDFFAVSIATARLQTVVRELSIASSTDHIPGRSVGRILLIPELTEQHTLGLQLVAEFFRRARWNVRLEQPETADQYVELVAKEYFDVVGVSVGSESRLDHLASRIALMRRVSKNRAVCVMVGGPIVLLQPELAKKLGADASAADGASAVRVAHQFIKSVASANSTYS